MLKFKLQVLIPAIASQEVFHCWKIKIMFGGKLYFEKNDKSKHIQRHNMTNETTNTFMIFFAVLFWGKIITDYVKKQT